MRKIVVAALPVMLGYSFPILGETIALACLAQYSLEAFAAIWPGFVVYFNTLMIPVGFLHYIRIPAAQEYARGRRDAVARLMLVGLTVVGVGTLAFVCLGANADWIFSLFGHPENIQPLEASYFRIMCFGAVFQMLVAAFEAFLLARSNQAPVFVVRSLGLIVNAALIPLLIFGLYGMPSLGIDGVAYASLISGVLMTLVYSVREPALRHIFGSWNYREYVSHLRRVTKFGLPSGIERGIEESGWTVVLLIIGTTGTFTLALANVAINLLELVLFPAIAFSEVLSVEIATRPREKRLVTGGLKVAALYGMTCLVGVMSLSNLVTEMYLSGASPPPGTSAEALYSQFFWLIGLCMIAGPLFHVANAVLLAKDDTFFTMAIMLVSVVTVLLGPLLYLSFKGLIQPTTGWALFFAHLVFIGIANGWRYNFRWRKPANV
jgi:multidrug resistance protein, MATE family